MKTNFKKLATKQLKPCLESLKRLVKFNSVNDPSTSDNVNPFGIEVTKCLKEFEDIAKEDGFKVTNYNNMIVEVEIGDFGKDVTILGHLDVVPAVGNWKHDPFDMDIRNEILYGRGVSDDKGPLLASYYAAKALYDNNLLNGFHVRILAGGNEETGSRGVNYYFEELMKPQPTIGFSPDASFPLVFAEKAIHFFKTSSKILLKDVISIEGGVANNAVIERATLKTKSEELVSFLSTLIPENEVEKHDDIYSFIAIGKSAHGSTPELGVNAGLNLLKALFAYDKNELLGKVIKAYCNVTPEGLGITKSSPTMGKNSMNIGFIAYKNETLTLNVDLRTVDGVTNNEVKECLKNNSPLEVKYFGASPLLYKELDSSLVKALLSAYQEETGDENSKPLAIGGGTYAKSCDNILAYGMEFIGYDSGMHDANESLPLKYLKTGMAIYMNAILKLGDIIK